MQLERFVQQYLETALWSSTDEDGEPLDKSYSVTDLSADTIKQAREDCRAFIAANEDTLDAVPADYSQHAHDFWLTRNHHGAGFWDRGYGLAGDVLTKAAHAFGEVDLYVGDDGTIYS
jgi:hypothetical protein